MMSGFVVPDLKSDDHDSSELQIGLSPFKIGKAEFECPRDLPYLNKQGKRAQSRILTHW